jgi:apolipoprotein N-acyltransferase
MGVPAADFGKDAWLHARMAVMRGVENGFALVRAADNGLVTASDAQGRLIASKMDTRPGLTMVVADLPLGPGPTLYARIGDAFVWLCAAFLLWIGADFFCKRHEQRGRPLPESEALGVHEFGEWPFAGILERDGPDHHHCREHGR